MPITNVLAAINNPRMHTTFTVLRSIGGDWADGAWQDTKEQLDYIGVVTGVRNKDIELFADGTRVNQMLTFYSTDELIVTADKQTSDLIEYKGKTYQLIQGFDYSCYGYYKAIGQALEGV